MHRGDNYEVALIRQRRRKVAETIRNSFKVVS